MIMEEANKKRKNFQIQLIPALALIQLGCEKEMNDESRT